jgi:branched-chain amino acid transport system ATP-binding protein
MVMSLLEIKNIDCFYGDVQVVYDVSMHVEEGEIISIIGANGAGKSTVLKCISGLVKATSGEIIFDGEPIHNLRPEKIVNRGVVQVPEGRKLFTLMTSKENLEVGAHNPRAYSRMAEGFEEVYKLLPRLKEREKQLAITMSGGEQQMVAVGRGLMANPKILMLDEPSLGLAPVLIQEIFQTVKKIADKGLTVLMVEQDVQHSLSMSDRGYVLEHGRIVQEGTGKDLLENANIREAYLGI